MADGYARATDKVAVVTAQNGPAAALLVGPLAEALKASVPIVAIVQDVRRTQTDKNAFQELEHFDIFRGCTKWVRRVTELSRIEDYVDMAFTAAASDRPGPAVLLFPQDLLLEAVNGGVPESRRAALGTYPLDRSLADPALSCDGVRRQRRQHAAPLLDRGPGKWRDQHQGRRSSGAVGLVPRASDRDSVPAARGPYSRPAADRRPLSGRAIAGGGGLAECLACTSASGDNRRPRARRGALPSVSHAGRPTPRQRLISRTCHCRLSRTSRPPVWPRNNSEPHPRELRCRCAPAVGGPAPR